LLCRVEQEFVMPPTEKGVSRREFARKAAMGAASASLLPLAGFQPNAEIPTAKTAVPAMQSPADGPKLSAQSQLEAELRWKSIVEQYSDRFTEAQKADLNRLCIFVQPSLDRIRAYAVGNGGLPGLYPKPLVERDKKPGPTAYATKPGKP
jgi:hypothetical protein